MDLVQLSLRSLASTASDSSSSLPPRPLILACLKEILATGPAMKSLLLIAGIFENGFKTPEEKAILCKDLRIFAMFLRVLRTETSEDLDCLTENKTAILDLFLHLLGSRRSLSSHFSCFMAVNISFLLHSTSPGNPHNFRPWFYRQYTKMITIVEFITRKEDLLEVADQYTKMRRGNLVSHITVHLKMFASRHMGGLFPSNVLHHITTASLQILSRSLTKSQTTAAQEIAAVDRWDFTVCYLMGEFDKDEAIWKAAIAIFREFSKHLILHRDTVTTVKNFLLERYGNCNLLFAENLGE